MRIIFDHQAFTMQTHGGISRSFTELFSYMPPDITSKIAVHETDNVYLRELNIGVPKGYDLKHFVVPFNYPGKGHLFRLYNHLVKGLSYQRNNAAYYYGSEYAQYESIKALKRGDFDVFHPTFYDDYFLPYLNRKPFVLTIHDMIPFKYDNLNVENWKWQAKMIRKLAPEASAIIAVSKNSKKDIVEILNIEPKKIHVIYHGSEHITVPRSKSYSLKDNLGFLQSSPYILYVGNREYYKNFIPWLRILTLTLKRHPELKVVCTGKKFNDEELQLINGLGISDRIIWHWVESDEELFYLYHNAVCFAYPSEYEGFGIPILEAYKADCPVMLNHTSCFPEIAGEAATYFHLDKDDSDFAEQFEKLYAWTDLERQNMIEKQRERLMIYSWKKSAEQLAEVYRTVAR